MAAKRRPRLVPKVVFRVAVTATAVPLLAGCPSQHYTVANTGYGNQVGNPVAQRGYDNPPEADASSALLPQPTVAAPAYVNPPPVDASADVKVDAASVDAGKVDAGTLDAGAKRDASLAGPALTAPPPKGVAYRGYELEGVAYRGYELPKASSGPPGTPPPKH